jgi:hypothetical protein
MRLRTILLAAAALATMLLPAALLPAALLPAAPAQATTSTNCIWYTVGPTNPGLQYATCALGGTDWMDGTVWIVNQSASTSHYVLKLEVFTDIGGWNTCYVNAWLAPGKSRSCSVMPFVNTPPGLKHAYGRPYFWAPALGAYDWRQGMSVPVLVS